MHWVETETHLRTVLSYRHIMLRAVGSLLRVISIPSTVRVGFEDRLFSVISVSVRPLGTDTCYCTAVATADTGAAATTVGTPIA
mgnify:CR=1 FL=1